MTSNPEPGGPDPHGQAALMLCESLACLLIEHGILDRREVVDAIDGLIEVKREIAGTSEKVVVSMTSIVLLQTVAQSLSAATQPNDVGLRALVKKQDKPV